MKRMLLALVIMGAAAACPARDTTIASQDDASAPDSAADASDTRDAGCQVPCGDGCCAQDEVCRAGVCYPTSCSESNSAFCTRLHVECGAASGTDLCGLPRDVAECGPCLAPDQCEEGTGQCVCTGETDADLCRAAQVACGPITAVDRCAATREIPDCGSCPSGRQCDPQGKCQCIVVETDAELCARLGRDCGSLTARDKCGQVRSVADCGTCASPKQCGANRADNICGIPGQATNDACGRAQTIIFDDDGVATFFVDTRIATDSGNGSCGEYSGNDVVYAFTLPSRKDVRIDVTPESNDTYPIIYVRRDCADSATEIDCAQPELGAAPFSFTMPGLAAGTPYYLWVDSFRSYRGSGPQTITVTLSDPPPPPANDTCVAAQPLAFVGQQAMATGTTAGALNDATGTCAAMPGGDVYYVFTPTEDTAIHVTVTATHGDFTPSFYILSDCGPTATPVVCVAGKGSTASGDALGMAMGISYLLVVDSTGRQGDFSLSIEEGVHPINDLCATAAVLAFDPVTGTAVARGDTDAAHDDIVSSCNPSYTGKDLVWAFEVPPGSPQDVTVEVAPSPGSALQPNVSVRSTCDQQATEIRCQNSYSANPLLVGLPSLSPGVYYLWLDGVGTARNGPFEMTVTMFPHPSASSNDTCATAALLTFDPATKTAVVRGDTSSLNDDISADCLGNPTNGKDAVWQLQVPAGGANQDLHVEITPAPNSSLSPVLSLRTTCDTATSTVACNGAQGMVLPLALGAYNLAAGATYYLWLDGTYGGQDGAFSMTATLSDSAAAPTNDACASVSELTFNAQGVAVANGSTAGLANDAASIACGSGSAGPDAVYHFNLPSARKVSLTLSPSVSFDAVLFVRKGDCASTQAGDEVACIDLARKGGVETWTTPVLDQGDYYVWVDGRTANDAGLFTLSVATASPVYGASCATARALVFDPVTNTASATGDTTNSINSVSSSCVYSTGNDLVWSYEVPAGGPRNVLITATPDWGSSFKPNLSVRTQCDQQYTEVGCTSASAVASPDSLWLRNQAPGTYYLWVDGSAAGADGSFALTATLSAPTVLNSSCDSAQVLTVDATTRSVTVLGDTSSSTNSTWNNCNSWNTGKDVVFSFTVDGTTPHDMTALITPLFGSTLTATPSLRSDCLSLSSELTCTHAPAYAAQTTLRARHLTSGSTYYLWVDADSGWNEDGAFELTLSLVESPAAPSNDACSGATPVLLDANGNGTETGDTTTAFNDSFGSCMAVGGSDPRGPSDVAYSFHLADVSNVAIEVTAATGSGLQQPVLYVRDGCGATAAELGCVAGSNGQVLLQLPHLAQGDYVLWVDSGSADGVGPFNLAIAATPATAPANDTCAGTPIALTLDSSGHASVTGSTFGAADDYAGTCLGSGNPPSGPDLVYSVQLATAQMIVVTVTRNPLSVNYLPAVYLRQAASCASADAADERGCATGFSGTAKLTSGTLPVGTYSIVVDGMYGTFGDFALDVQTHTAPSNDSCVHPELLAFSPTATSITVTGDTAWASNDSGAVGCAGDSGNDVVYEINTVGLGRRILTATVTFTDPSLGTLLSLRTQCASSAPADEVFCSRAWGYGPPAKLTTNLTREGTYYLWVDGSFAWQSGGPFTLTVSLDPLAAPPANDTCAAAQHLTFDSTGRVSVTGSTATANPDYTLACGTAATNGPEVVYAFSLAQASSVVATVVPDPAAPGSQGYYPALFLESACGSATPAGGGSCSNVLKCASTSYSTQIQTTSNYLEMGDYYVVVGGVANTSGSFTLVLQAGAASTLPEVCAVAAPLVFDLAGHASVTGDTAQASDDAMPQTASCAGWPTYSGITTGPDLVYRVDVTDTRDLVAQVRFDQMWVTPLVYLRSTCCSDAATAQLSCTTGSSGGGATLYQAGLTRGSYYLWVDSLYGTPGSFTLDVDLLVPPPPTPPNGTCATAASLAFDATGVAHALGATLGGANNATGSCGAMDGPDVVYTLDVGSGQILQVAVAASPFSPAFSPAFSLRSDCPGNGATNEVACAVAGAAGGTALTTLSNLAAGSYYLIVDGTGGTSGQFDVRVERFAVSTNTCAQAPRLDFDPSTGSAVARADTSLSSDRVTSTCAASYTGKDVVFTFDVPASGPKDLTLSATPNPGSSLAPALAVRSACTGVEAGDRASELPKACKASMISGGTASVSLSRLAPGTYFVWVDGSYPGADGPFTLTAIMTDPPPAPANDACSNASSLGLAGLGGAPETVTLSAVDTSLASDDYSGSCAPTNGPDLVYSFTTQVVRSLSVTATPTAASSNYKPAVYLRSVCDSAAVDNEWACGRSTVGGGAATLAVSALPAGTYYLIVDGTLAWASDAPGSFDLTATLDAPPASAPANDTCATAQTIALPGGGGRSIALSGQTTVGAADNSYGMCGADMGAPDVVYRFTVAVPSQLTITVTPDATYAPAVYLHGGSCGGLSGVNLVACSSTWTPGTTVTLTAPSLHAGTYYLWVDSGTYTAANAAGTFDLSITVDAAAATPPVNDTCAGAIALTYGVPESGDTTDASNDYDWGSSNATNCQPQPSFADGQGRELVYSYTPSANGAFAVTTTPTNGCMPAVWVSSGACGDARSCLGGTDAAPFAVTVANATAGTTYWIYVEGYGFSTSPCLFTVTVAAP